MRASRLFIAAALLGLAGCHKAQPAASVTPIAPPGAGPMLAPGLWIERVSDASGAQVSRICVDAASAAALAAMNGSLAGHCSRRDIAPAANGGWRFSTDCEAGPGAHVAIVGVIRGDFASHYRIVADSKTFGASQRTTHNPGRVVADVRRAGDCPADMRPGDVVLANGARTRLTEIAQHS
jgi:hypothetical protein